MTKEQYITRLREQLSYFEGDHTDIINNYDSIIDELIDEGLTMQDIIQRLGRPGVLAEDIAEEFELSYTQQSIQQIQMPLWARNLLIIAGLILVVPMILSLVLGAARILFGVVGGTLFILLSGFFRTGSLWGSSLSMGYKFVLTTTSILGIVSALIMTYFLVYWLVQAGRMIIGSFKPKQGGK